MYNPFSLTYEKKGILCIFSHDLLLTLKKRPRPCPRFPCAVKPDVEGMTQKLLEKKIFPLQDLGKDGVVVSGAGVEEFILNARKVRESASI